MFRFRSIITQHFLNSLLMLAFVLTYVYFGITFTKEMENDGEMINLAGSLRYRSYKLLAITQQSYDPAFHRESALLPAREEIDRIRSAFAYIENGLLRDAGGRSEQVGQLQALSTRWETEVIPLANQLVAKNGSSSRALVRFKEITDVFVRDVDSFVTKLSSHNRADVIGFNNRNIVLVLVFLPMFVQIAYFSKKHLIRPIIALQNASELLMEGNFSVRLPIVFRNEVGLLTDRFNKTAAALEELFITNTNYSQTLGSLNSASSRMISMGSRGEIYQFACNTAHQLLSPDMVWLGLVEPASSRLKIVSCVGDEYNYTDELAITCDDSPTGNGPVGMAIKNREPRLVSIHDDVSGVWVERIQRHGYGSFLVLPLLTSHGCLGAITLYSKQPDFFAQGRVELCQIFANHTSAAIEAMNLLHYVVFALARAAEVNDEDTGNHIMRVGDYSALLAEEMGLDSTFVEQIRFQATLHDVGKLYLNSSILKKHGPLTPEEWELMQRHTTNGARIIGEHPMLVMARDIALNHHERWNGSGYPAGLQGEQIPLSARIMCIADQYDALRNSRVYKPAIDHATSCAIITEGDGRTLPGHFDPEVLAAFTRVAHRFDEIYERLA